MQHFEIIIFVFAILIALLALANKMRITNPILLVIAGLVLGFIPSLPAVVLDPEVVFLLFLPPILYDAATRTSWHDFKLEIRPISRLAIALVFLTTMTVAITCYFFIPGFTWPLAFVLGAIVSPPDAAVATSITKGLGLNKRVITILQGESLVNDASALIAYRFAIAALGSGVFIFWKAGLGFLILAVGGVLAGLAVGYVVINIHKRIKDNSIISTSLTLLTPFLSYLVAERIYSSGVLAVVTTGLMISWRAPEIFTFHTRIRNRAVWDTVIFLLNAFIFILIGLQLPLILEDLLGYATADLIMYGLLVSGVTIAVRIMWVFGAANFPFGTKKSQQGPEQTNTWKNVLIMAWSGSRGVVSLATALAMPLALSNGDAFPERSLILFLAFVVILVTLVIQGLSLPLLIKLLGVKSDEVHTDEEVKLRLLMATNAINFIDNDLSDSMSRELKMQIKSRYTEIVHFLSKELEMKTERKAINKRRSPHSSHLYEAQSKITSLQRNLLIGFHKDPSYTQSIIRQLERELDHEELELYKTSSKRA
ncbi:MAG: Na+/H+ antiporter [Cyclobacteriaceae bacterium]|nr:Na+/H+ antiporter [Cyclobacteriaceae bacterium]